MDDKLNPALFASQPQIQFKLPDGPYDVVEDPPGVVQVFSQGRTHPILIMSKGAAEQLGWTDPDPPTSGTRLSPDNPDEEDNDG